jgi:hypothetical protein
MGLTLSQRKAVTSPDIGDLSQRLGPCSHLDVEGVLAAGDDSAGRLEQNPQLSVGMRGTEMSQDHHSAVLLARDLHRQERSAPINTMSCHHSLPSTSEKKQPHPTTMPTSRRDQQRQPAPTVRSWA